MKSFLDRNIPRYLIFLADSLICLVSLYIAYQVRFNFSIPQTELNTFYFVFPFFALVRMSSFLVFRTYAGIIRYTSTRDSFRILLTLLSGSLVLVLANLIRYSFTGSYVIPFSIVIIEYLCSIFLLVTGRLLVRVIYMELRNPSRERTGVVIFGAGEAGLITKRTIDRDKGIRYKAVAFIDDDPRKAGKKLEGIPIYTPENLETTFRELDIKHIILAVQDIPPARKQEIVEAALAQNVRVLNVPPVQQWINGELSFKQIRKINIEELLGREPIQLDLGRIRKELSGKTILVSGAAGSIGSELIRQIIPFRPKLLIALDMAESPMYELETEIMDYRNLPCKVETIIGDIRYPERMNTLFEKYRPEIIFHAAAYKHVPVMENNPCESVRNNIFGTRTLADLALRYNCERFIMISTDKAVNPTNIMGATKRIAEIYIQSLNEHNKTRFITTRFGNVLGSNGSVIPRFRKQIESGQAVTVTHPEVTRYFMTISEACQLVLEASAMGQGGEIFLFDMGQSVRIADLAKKMIRLSGLEIGKDVQIVYTGLRPGEKLYEELLADEENTLPTHHPKIMIAKVKNSDLVQVLADLAEMEELLSKQNAEALVSKMKKMIPEYISHNSVYERLDDRSS